MTTRLAATHLLRLHTRPVYILVALYVLTNTVNCVAAISDIASPAVGFAQIALTAIGALILVRPSPDPLPLAPTIVVTGITVLVTAGSWNLPRSGWPGWASWFWAATIILLFVLCLKGRKSWAWTGFAAHVAVIGAWVMSVGRPPLEIVDFTVRHGALLVVVTGFALLLDRLAGRISVLHASEHDRLVTQARSNAALHVQAQRLDALRKLAGDDLDLLASDAELTPAHAERFRYLEATIRDWLRAGTLGGEALARAVADARKRSVDVILLDDREEALDPDDATLVEDTAVTVLSSLDNGRLVVRLLPPDRELLATVRGGDGDHDLRIDIPASA